MDTIFFSKQVNDGEKCGHYGASRVYTHTTFLVYQIWDRSYSLTMEDRIDKRIQHEMNTGII